MQAFPVWHGLVPLAVFCVSVWLLVRDCRRRTDAANVPSESVREWLFLFAFLCCLGSLLAMLPELGIIVTRFFPDAEMAKAIAALFSVSVRVKGTSVD
jgi:nitrate/nitrite transporter NarK